MALQLRRGTNKERLGVTLVEGEMVYVTDHAYQNAVVTSINATTNTLTTTLAHGLTVGQKVKFMGATANGLTAQTVYYVKTVPGNYEFTLSTTSGGSTLDITGTWTVDLEFAKTPTDVTGTPIGYAVSPLWAGDGVTVGGVAAGVSLLNDLTDVSIGVYGNVSQYGEALADNNVIQYNATSGQWENRATLLLDGHMEQKGQTLKIDSDSAGGDSQIYFKGTTAQIRYDATDDRFELNKDIVANGVQGGNVKMGMTADNVINIGGDNLYLQTDSTSYNVIANTGVNATRFSQTGNYLYINSDSAGGDSYVSFIGNNAGYIRYNATTNTFDFSHAIDTDQSASFGLVDISKTSGAITTSSGNLAISANSGSTVVITSDLATDPVRLVRTSNATNSTVRVLTLRLDSTGTPSVGLAPSLEWEVETPSGSFVKAGAIELVSTDYTNGSENATMYFDVLNAGSLGRKASLDNIGNFSINGDLTVTGNDIKSTANTCITLDNNSIIVAGDLTVNGQEIKSNGGTTAIELSGANVTAKGNLTVVGDLTVNGTTTTLNTQTVLIEDNILTLNSNVTGTPTTDGGIEIERGDSTNASIIWQETASPKQWYISNRTQVNGDVSVIGNLFTESGGNVYVDGAFLTLNNGNAATTCDIIVDRGTNDAILRWNETTDRWQTTVDGSTFINIPNQALDTTSNPTFAGATAGNIQIGITGDNEIDTASGNLTIDSASGTTIVDDVLQVNDDLNVNNKLFVDASTGYVGINDTTPNEALDVTGNVNVTGSITGSQLSLDNGLAKIDTTTFTSTSATTTIAETTGNLLKVLVHMQLGTQVHCVELLALRHGTQAILTAYGDLNSVPTAPIATYDAEIVGGVAGGNLKITATGNIGIVAKIVTIQVS